MLVVTRHPDPLTEYEWCFYVTTPLWKPNEVLIVLDRYRERTRKKPTHSFKDGPRYYDGQAMRRSPMAEVDVHLPADVAAEVKAQVIATVQVTTWSGAKR